MLWILVAGVVGVLIGISIMTYAWTAHDEQAMRKGEIVLEGRRYHLLPASGLQPRRDRPYGPTVDL